MDVTLHPLLLHLPVWALVLFRLTGIFLLAPVFGGTAIPARVKVFLAVGLSFCVYPVLLGMAATPEGALQLGAAQQLLAGNLSLWALPAAIAGELMIGLAIGFGASLPMMGMQVAGQIGDQQMGLGLAGIFNPDIDDEVGVLGQFYFTLAIAIYLILGGHRVVLGTLLGSFGHVPMGGFTASGELVAMLLGLMTTAFELALRVAAPLLCLVFLETVAMGFLARTVPQINILSVGFALRIVVALLVLVGSLSTGAGAFAETLGQSLGELRGFFAPQ